MPQMNKGANSFLVNRKYNTICRFAFRHRQLQSTTPGQRVKFFYLLEVKLQADFV